MKVFMAQDLLKANVGMAVKNREIFSSNGTLVVNIIGSPGAGKTALLEQTLDLLAPEFKIAVIEGDIYTSRDVERLENKGAELIQINTAGGCHLDAGMVAGVMGALPLDEIDIIFIENIGNLVCPAEFDLGEDCKVVVLSSSEGGDKPAKYPVIFRKSEVCVITKTDLIPYTNFDLSQVTAEIEGINGNIKIFPLAAVKGEGLGAWTGWLKMKLAEKRGLPAAE